MFQNNVLGIDIGNKNIAFALVKQGKLPYIMDTALVPTPPKSIQNSEFKNIDEICNCINSVILEKRFKAKYIALSINYNQIVTREFKIPNVKKSEIFNSIQLDLSKNFPGIEETHTTSFKVHSKDRAFIQGVVTICPNKIIEEYTDLGFNLNIPLKYVDIAANAIAKTYKHFIMGMDDKRSILIVDVGCSSSSVNIIRNGKLVMSRNVSIGGSAIDKLVAKEFKISEQEAEMNKLKKYKELVSKGYDIDEHIKKAYAPIEQEIGQTLSSYKQNYDEQRIDEILFIGGGSFLTGVDVYFKKIFNIPATVVGPIHNNVVYINQFSKLVCAIGAATREE